MNPEEIEAIGLYPCPKKPWCFTDMEDIWFDSKTKELFHHSCVDGELTFYRTVKDVEDLKQALYDGFPDNRKELNLD